MGPLIKSAVHGWMLRLPMALSLALTFGVWGNQWKRPSKCFHELMSQPAPHGSYLRRSVREHFPIWWHAVSAELYQSGVNLPEMNEYDKATEMPTSHTHFDTGLL